MEKEMLTEELQIASRAKKFKQEALTNLHQFIDVDFLRTSFKSLNKKSASGVDNKTWYDYEQDLENRLPQLLVEFKSGKYQSPPIRRVYINKGKKGKRPLGIPTIEDKILQESVRRVLNPIYENDFKDFSYGFRKCRSAHQAIEFMFKEVSFKSLHHIIDADITNFFGTINHGILREFLDLRVKDGVIRKIIDKWLKAGILENGQLHYPSEGTPQGGLISPLLANIYLNYVLDKWFLEEIQPLLSGESFIVRYADDFVLGFENAVDTERVMKVLSKRFNKFNLELHSDKTKVVNLTSKRGNGDRSFDFLGFTHYLGKSRKGYMILKRKTSKKKLAVALDKILIFIKINRDIKLQELISAINVKLDGHYGYYGITFNSKGINNYFEQVQRILQKWLNRRGGKSVWNWDRFNKLITLWHPLLKPKIYHSYKSAKPI
ncbi:MAG: group II intron reverse transcriptase/maturase [Desulfobacterales bacterium]|nr:group II intron reverse transcriptase/maturase [Desulfobacterales bacterium]